MSLTKIKKRIRITQQYIETITVFLLYNFWGAGKKLIIEKGETN